MASQSPDSDLDETSHLHLKVCQLARQFTCPSRRRAGALVLAAGRGRNGGAEFDRLHPLVLCELGPRVLLGEREAPVGSVALACVSENFKGHFEF